MAALTAAGAESLSLLRLPPLTHCAGGALCHHRLPTCLPRFLLKNWQETFFNSTSYCLNMFLQKTQRELIKPLALAPAS